MAAMLLGLLTLALAMPIANAAQDTTAISQGFKVQGDVVTGALVRFTDDKERSAVTAASTETASALAGVVGDKQLVELSDGTQQSQVVISGTTPALVSNINGDVRSGDKITASPLTGIGMRAGESTQVIGTAQQDFSNAESVVEREVDDLQGNKRTVKIGLLPVQVNVSYYSAPEDDLAFLPDFLQRFAEVVAGREVGPIRVLIALALLIAGFGGAAVLLYSTVRSSIISIGRNPLSEQAVHRGLLEVGGIALGILLVMLIAVYLVLVI